MMTNELPPEDDDKVSSATQVHSVQQCSSSPTIHLGEAMPQPGIPGLNREAEKLERTGDEEKSTKRNKKTNEPWKHSLSVMSKASDQLLNVHLPGKKHKAELAKLKTNQEIDDAGGNSHEKSHKLVICAGNTKLEQENDVNKDQQIEGNRISIGQRIAHMEDTRNEHCLKPELRQQKLVTYTCQICNLHTNSKAQLDIHKKGRKHMSMLQKNGGSDRNSGGKSHKSVELTGNEQQIRREGNSNVPEAAVLEELENSRSQKPKLSEQKAKYWCKMCDVGTNSEEHMNDHRKGKEHMTLLRKNGGAVIVVANKLQM